MSPKCWDYRYVLSHPAFLCVHMWVQGCMLVHVHVCAEDKCEPWMLFLRSGPPCAMSSGTCLFLLPQIASGFVCGCWGSSSGPHTSRASIFINGATFPAHLVPVVKSFPLQWKEVTGRAEDWGWKRVQESRPWTGVVTCKRDRFGSSVQDYLIDWIGT